MKNQELERVIRELGQDAVERGVAAGISRDKLRQTGLGIDEVCKITGAKPATVRVWRQRGFAPYKDAISIEAAGEGRYSAVELSKRA